MGSRIYLDIWGHPAFAGNELRFLNHPTSCLVTTVTEFSRLLTTKPKELQTLTDGPCRCRKGTQKPEHVTKVTATLFSNDLKVITARIGRHYGSNASLAEVSRHNRTDITLTVLQNYVEAIYYPTYALHNKHMTYINSNSFGNEVPPSWSYYTKGVQANLPIYVAFIVINIIKPYVS